MRVFLWRGFVNGGVYLIKEVILTKSYCSNTLTTLQLYSTRILFKIQLFLIPLILEL